LQAGQLAHRFGRIIFRVIVSLPLLFIGNNLLFEQLGLGDHPLLI
jgi:hypothetical protein